MKSTLRRAAARTGVVAVLAACACPLPTGRADAATYVVNRRHPQAGDENAGTAEEPFKTIGRAAQAVRAGDTVIIRGGVYRESVAVEASGTADRPITFAAGAADRVIVTGADEITDWRREKDEGNVFSAPWPHRFIAWNRHFTHPDDDFHRLVGRCEQVFVHGYLLRQVLRREKLSRGTFYVDLAGKRLLVWSRDNRDLTKRRVPVEASTRTTTWVSKGDHVHLKGIRFRCAANAAQRGAVQVLGDHNVVADCVFEKANSIGAQFRGRSVVVRRCVFQDNGQMGFSAVGAHDLLITGCTCRRNNTKGYSRGWEAGGNKIVLCRGLVLEKSVFTSNRGNGIWFDIGNEKCTVRNCLIADNDEAGVFYEISYGLHAHDNVVVGNGFGGSSGAWGADGGISISSSPGCVVERNLIVGNKEGFQFREQVRSTPKIDDGRKRRSHPVWNHDHVIRRNVIAFNRDLQVGGWFDVTDGRHWPKAMQTPAAEKGKAAADIAAKYKAKPAKGPPPGTSLEDLKITFEGNLYCTDAGQGLWQWGCRWRRHRKYATLDDVRSQLGLEAGGRVQRIVFGSYAARDFRVPADSPAIRMKCYPRGAVPGARLGTK